MDIAVVGSANLDTVLVVDRLPQTGETVTATAHFTNPGGKGANQAVAAARLGRSVAFVGCVGNDPAGETLTSALTNEGIDVSCLAAAAAPTGTAIITVGPQGSNTIVVSPGANGEVRPALVTDAASVIGSAAAVMVQLEIPLDSVVSALGAATGLTLLNPAPGQSLDDAVVGMADVVVPNETELGLLAGTTPPQTPAAAIEMAAHVGTRVVVTMGEQGAVFFDNGDSGHVAASTVAAVDSTAAGDAFCAGLVDALLDDADLGNAVEWAVRVGTTTVTRHGAQASLPTRSEVL